MRHREYYTEKHCAPMCTVSCVQQVGILDNWRGPQTLKPKPMAPPAAPQRELVQIGSTRSDSWRRTIFLPATDSLFSLRAHPQTWL